MGAAAANGANRRFGLSWFQVPTPPKNPQVLGASAVQPPPSFAPNTTSSIINTLTEKKTGKGPARLAGREFLDRITLATLASNFRTVNILRNCLLEHSKPSGRIHIYPRWRQKLRKGSLRDF